MPIEYWIMPYIILFSEISSARVNVLLYSTLRHTIIFVQVQIMPTLQSLHFCSNCNIEVLDWEYISGWNEWPKIEPL